MIAISICLMKVKPQLTSGQENELFNTSLLSIHVCPQDCSKCFKELLDFSCCSVVEEYVRHI